MASACVLPTTQADQFRSWRSCRSFPSCPSFSTHVKAPSSRVNPKVVLNPNPSPVNPLYRHGWTRLPIDKTQKNPYAHYAAQLDMDTSLDSVWIRRAWTLPQYRKIANHRPLLDRTLGGKAFLHYKVLPLSYAFHPLLRNIFGCMSGMAGGSPPMRVSLRAFLRLGPFWVGLLKDWQLTTKPLTRVCPKPGRSGMVVERDYHFRHLSLRNVKASRTILPPVLKPLASVLGAQGLVFYSAKPTTVRGDTNNQPFLVPLAPNPVTSAHNLAKLLPYILSKHKLGCGKIPPGHLFKDKKEEIVKQTLQSFSPLPVSTSPDRIMWSESSWYHGNTFPTVENHYLEGILLPMEALLVEQLTLSWGRHTIHSASIPALAREGLAKSVSIKGKPYYLVTLGLPPHIMAQKPVHCHAYSYSLHVSRHPLVVGGLYRACPSFDSSHSKHQDDKDTFLSLVTTSIVDEVSLANKTDMYYQGPPLQAYSSSVKFLGMKTTLMNSTESPVKFIVDSSPATKPYLCPPCLVRRFTLQALPSLPFYTHKPSPVPEYLPLHVFRACLEQKRSPTFQSLTANPCLPQAIGWSAGPSQARAGHRGPSQARAGHRGPSQARAGHRGPSQARAGHRGPTPTSWAMFDKQPTCALPNSWPVAWPVGKACKSSGLKRMFKRQATTLSKVYGLESVPTHQLVCTDSELNGAHTVHMKNGWTLTLRNPKSGVFAEWEKYVTPTSRGCVSSKPSSTRGVSRSHYTSGYSSVSQLGDSGHQTTYSRDNDKGNGVLVKVEPLCLLPSKPKTLLGYKFLVDSDGSAAIAVLAIPPSVSIAAAKGETKHRGAKAYVDSIHTAKGKISAARSAHDPSFVYTSGTYVTPHCFNPDLRIVCTGGIHFFKTLQLAMEYAHQAEVFPTLYEHVNGPPQSMVDFYDKHFNNA